MAPRIAFIATLLAVALAPGLPARAQGESAGAKARSMPGPVASCHARTEREALSDGSFDRVEWETAGGSAKIHRVRPENGPSFQRVEVSGRMRAATPRSGKDAWTPFKSRCDYVKGHEVAMELDIERPLVARLDLGLSHAAAPAGRPAADTPVSEFRALPPPAQGLPPNLSMGRLLNGLKPTFSEVPYELPVTRRQDDFMYNHQFGLRLNTPF